MSEYSYNELKRENITANIIFCVIFSIGSFVFYKKTENVLWAVALFVCSIVLLAFYSKILALEDEMVTIEESDESVCEEIQEEEEEEDEEEVRRSIFIKNLPAFKREARIKYNETAKQLGRSVDCLSDGIIDVWLVDGRIISMLKWKQIEKDLEDFEGEYADMIIDGMSGRNLEFEYTVTNSDVDIDMIMSKRSRKKVISFSIKDIEIIAPIENLDDEVFGKEIDASAHDPRYDVYYISVVVGGVKTKVLINPTKKILDIFEQIRPDKVIRGEE